MEELTKYTNTAHVLKTNELVDKVNLLESEGDKIQKIKVNNQDLPISSSDKSVNIDLTSYADKDDIYLYVGKNTPLELREGLIIIDPDEANQGINMVDKNELGYWQARETIQLGDTRKLYGKDSGHYLLVSIKAGTTGDIQPETKNTTGNQSSSEIIDNTVIWKVVDLSFQQTIDNDFDVESTNPLQNKVISTEVNNMWANLDNIDTDLISIWADLDAKQKEIDNKLSLDGGLLKASVEIPNNNDTGVWNKNYTAGITFVDKTLNLVGKNIVLNSNGNLLKYTSENNGNTTLSGVTKVVNDTDVSNKKYVDDNNYIYIGENIPDASAVELKENRIYISPSELNYVGFTNSIVEKIIANNHNNLYRGDFLGNEFTQKQSDAIRTGKFSDLFVGDYWTINGVNWRIAHIDYYLNRCGCNDHHLVIIPENNLYQDKMNTTAVTTKAYIGSYMYKTGLIKAKELIEKAFGVEHLLSITKHFANAVQSDYESDGKSVSTNIWLMNENSVYGSNNFHNFIHGYDWDCRYTEDICQYSIFSLNTSMIFNNESYWLRDVAASADFCNVSLEGICDCSPANEIIGVRPAFCIY